MRVIGICVFLYLYVHANCMVCKALKVKIKEGKYFKAIVYRECDQVTWEEYRDFVQAFRDAVRKVEVHLLLKMVKDVVLVSGRI